MRGKEGGRGVTDPDLVGSVSRRRIRFFILNLDSAFQAYKLSNIKLQRNYSSVVDPNALNLDPDPDQEFWPNLDLDPGLPTVCCQF